jgi:hypothetical protein
MKCNQCGQECSREEQTCQKCGNNLGVKYSFNEIDFVFDDDSDQELDHKSNCLADQDQQQESYLVQKSKFHRGKWIPILAGSVILFGTLLVMSILLKPSNQNKENLYVPLTQKSLASFISNINDIYSFSLVSLDGESVSITGTEQVYNHSSSVSREVVVFTDSDQNLYAETDKEHISIDNNVLSLLVSMDGSGVAYIKDVAMEKRELYSYDMNTKSTTKIASGVSPYYYVISPDGKSIAYSTEGENRSQQELYVSVDKKEAYRIAPGFIPLGISNHGKFLYALGEAGFYVFIGGEMIRLGNESNPDEFRPTFNLDYTQVLYYEDGKSYLSEEGKVTKLGDGSIYNVVLPPDAGYYWRSSGTSSFVNHVVQKEDGYYYLNDEYKLIYLFNSAVMWQVAADSESLIILENNQLYLLKDFNQKEISKIKISDEQHIKNFAANADLSNVYYINDKKELYSYKSGDKPLKIAEDVFNCTYNFMDGFWYYVTEIDRMQEGILYYSTNQGTGIRVKNIDRGNLYQHFSGIISSHNIEGDYSDTYVLIQGEAKKVLSRVSPTD